MPVRHAFFIDSLHEVADATIASGIFAGDPRRAEELCPMILLPTSAPIWRCPNAISARVGARPSANARAVRCE